MIDLLSENFSITKGGNIKEGGNSKARKEDRARRRLEARRSFPLENWHKANFNGAAKGNPRPAGSKGIIRNNLGGRTMVISFPLGHQTNHLAEASAARHVVKLALALGIDHLWLEGDSLNIINCILGITKPTWIIVSIIEDLKSDLRKFKKYHVSHVYREANMAANWFANATVTNNSVMTWGSDIGFLTTATELIRKEKI